MNSLKFKYLIVEDDSVVWANIEKRMKSMENWECCGATENYDDAIDIIQKYNPNLIFLDWSFRNGNAYELLDFVKTINNYHPYVIFFTGYQSEHPEIPQEIINNYSFVKKYLVKPIYENLSKNLSDYIKEAEKLIANSKKTQLITIENYLRQKIRINPLECIAFIQSQENSRLKNLYFEDGIVICIKYTWDECLDFAKKFNMDIFVTNKRKSMVNLKYVERIIKPYIYLKNDLKIELSRESWQEISQKIS